MKSNLLILTERPLHSAPRVIRQIKALENKFNLHIAASGKPFAGNYIFYPFQKVDASVSEKLLRKAIIALNKVPLINIFPYQLYKIKKLIQHIQPDYIITHEPFFLPYLTKLKNKCKFKLIFNTHEYYPLEFEDRKGWATTWQIYYENLYRTYLPQVDLFINVCQSIAEKCKKEFNKDSIVIPNASSYHDLNPVKIPQNGPIHIIHHGGCQPSRKIEEMIEVARLLGEGYQLDLMLTLQGTTYYRQIKELASAVSNVKIIEPVEFGNIVPFTNSYDIGIFLLPPTNYNNSVALPNKFFEFLQARLCIAIGPSPEMGRYVNEYKLGIVSDDFSAENLADKIRKLSREDIYQYKLNAHKAAKKLSAENYDELLINSIVQI
jgi:hypothetical protein